MAGENEGREPLEFSNSNSSYSLNLVRLRERVKDYIDKVIKTPKFFDVSAIKSNCM